MGGQAANIIQRCLRHPRRSMQMSVKIGTKTRLTAIAIIGLCFWATSATLAEQAPRWKLYSNVRWGFCISYPVAWHLHEGFDRTGMDVSPPRAGLQSEGSGVWVGALPNQLVDTTSGPPMTLDQNFRVKLDGLRKYDGAQDIHVLRRRITRFLGDAALATVLHYRDPVSGATWVVETLWFNHKQAVYSLELRCRPRELNYLKPIYAKMLRTFSYSCGGRGWRRP
jgi:hypothetical protein